MLNKMLAENVKKIKLALKNHPVKLVVATLSFFIIVVVLVVADRKSPSAERAVKPSSTCAFTVPATTECLDLEVADTSESRVKGLSDRSYLPQDKGLLFIFDNESEQCFWMKDMNFSIDMIFMDNDKRILKIYSKVSPDTYPDTFCADETKYVLEVNSGLAQKLSEGQIINF